MLGGDDRGELGLPGVEQLAEAEQDRGPLGSEVSRQRGKAAVAAATAASTSSMVGERDLAGDLAGGRVGHRGGAAAGALAAGAVDPVRDGWAWWCLSGAGVSGEVLGDQLADGGEHPGAGLAGLGVPAEDAGGQDAVEADARGPWCRAGWCRSATRRMGCGPVPEARASGRNAIRCSSPRPVTTVPSRAPAVARCSALGPGRLPPLRTPREDSRRSSGRAPALGSASRPPQAPSPAVKQ